MPPEAKAGPGLELAVTVVRVDIKGSVIVAEASKVRVAADAVKVVFVAVLAAYTIAIRAKIDFIF